MTGFEAGQSINAILVILLTIRLSALHLFGVYRALFCFLLLEIFESFAFIIISSLSGRVDYRLMWGGVRFLAWTLMLWTVYSILSKVLKSLPGILRFSRYALNSVFCASIVIGVITVIPEYNSITTTGVGSLIRRATILLIVMERAITMSAFISLLAILLFIVWFPVTIPRNPVIFSIGLVLYLGTKTCLLLARTYFFRASQQTLDDFNYATMAALAICFVCWSVMINRAGEQSTSRIGHSWQASEQARLILQLETMNSNLLRSRP